MKNKANPNFQETETKTFFDNFDHNKNEKMI